MAKTAISVKFFGLDGSGKTSFLYCLKLGEPISTIQTIGFNMESIKSSGCDIDCWDIGGHEKIRHLWKNYFSDTDLITYFVDGSDTERLDEARKELGSLLAEEDFIDIPFLCVATKSDLTWSLSPREFEEKLGLKNVHRKIEFFKCSTMIFNDVSYIFEAMASRLSQNPDLIRIIEHNALYGRVDEAQKQDTAEGDELKKKDYGPEEDDFTGNDWDLAIKLIILGPEGAGKSTILYQLLFQEASFHVPNMHIQEQLVSYKGQKYRCFDLVGSPSCQKVWHHFYHRCDAILFVINGKHDLESSKTSFLSVINHAEFLQKSPIAILVNDHGEGCAKAADVVEIWGLGFIRDIKWKVFDVDATKYESLGEPMQWITDCVS